MQKMIKSLAFSAMANPLRLLSRLHRLQRVEKAVILNLHRVAPDDGSSYRPLSPELFEELLRFIKPRFHVCTLDGLEGRSERPKLVLSFDDGYADFFEYACPLLERYDIVANINLIPECIQSGLPPLNVMVQDFIGKAPDELVRGLDIPGFRGPIDKRSGAVVSAFLKFRPMREQQRLCAHLKPQFEQFNEFRPTKMMDLQQVREVAARHEVGAHSYSHASMKYETDEFLELDVRRCRQFFRETLGYNVEIYAFPNGSCTPRQVALVKSGGIRHVLLVGEDANDCSVISRGVLSRFTFDASSRSEVRFRALGARAAI